MIRWTKVAKNVGLASVACLGTEKLTGASTADLVTWVGLLKWGVCVGVNLAGLFQRPPQSY